MGIIEQLDPPSFSNYIKKYRNTICGRHPIGVLLNVSIIEELQRMVTVKNGSGTKEASFDSRQSTISVLPVEIMIDYQSA